MSRIRSPWAKKAVNRIKKTLDSIRVVGRSRGPGDYGDDPVGYVKNILNVKVLWSRQEEMLRALLRDPYRVLAPSAHGVGKTFIAACAANWWYDSFDPGVCISTAPDHRSVCDLLWAEIRIQRQRAGLGDLMPAAPEMRSSSNHYAKGFTALNGNSFQGRHPDRLLLIMDEAAGVAPVFWSTSESMFHRRPGFAWLAILNPTDTGCQAYKEDQTVDENGNPKWMRFSLDALEHPNIKGRGKDDPQIIPNAVSWSQVNEWVHAWCDPIPASEATDGDLEWPAKSGKWWRQGPIFLARARGRWPTGQAFAVWSDSAWAICCQAINPIDVQFIPEIGCDVARYGDDFTSVHVRWHHTSVSHESRNGWNTAQIAGWLKETAEKWADEVNRQRGRGHRPIDWRDIPIKVDDDGVGGGVVDLLGLWGAKVIPVNAATRSMSGRYPNKRNELWFQVADRGTVGHVSLARLPASVRDRMRQQALAVQWALLPNGQRVVEPKDATKEKIGRSPDDLDAMNLAYLEGYDMGTAQFVEGHQRSRDPLTQEQHEEITEDLGILLDRGPAPRKIW